MAISDDFAIDATTKVISYTGASHGSSGAGYYTVLEFHRWLQDLADDAGASGNDYMDISRQTPSDKAFDTIIYLVNGYTIDETTLVHQHLYNGSIIQGSGGTEVYYDGVQVIAGSGAVVQIVQNGAVLTDEFWNTIPFGTGIKGLNPDTSNGIASRFMIKVRDAGADIDGRRLLLQTREWGKTFSEFKINGTSRGVNVAALTYADDLNNATASGTIAALSGITNVTAGYNGIVVDGTTTQYFYSKWNTDGNSANTFYERMKYITRKGETGTIYGLAGHLFRGITHQWNYDNEASGPFTEGVALTWGTGATAGSGQLLALLDSGTTGTMWIQLLTGVPPTDNLTINQTGGKTCLVNGSVTERTLSFPFCGASTGTAIIGAFGFGIEAADLTVNDKLFDLSNALAQPPNLVTFTVSGLVTNEDYVLVGPSSGGVLEETQFALSGTLNAINVTSVVVSTTIPSDTPTTGSIRIKRNNGAWSKHTYSARAGSTFTIASTDFSSNPATSGNNVYISYIDQLITSGTTLSFQTTYLSNRSLFVRRRDGGASPTKTFEGVGTLGSAGGSVSVQRLSDA
jgi:hypothetical protein